MGNLHHEDPSDGSNSQLRGIFPDFLDFFFLITTCLASRKAKVINARIMSNHYRGDKTIYASDAYIHIYIKYKASRINSHEEYYTSICICVRVCDRILDMFYVHTRLSSMCDE